MLIVSAYAKKGHVSHTHYEHGSILKFVEETFGLPALAASDTRATAPDDAFDFNKPPRKFQTVPSAVRHRLLHASGAGPPHPGYRITRKPCITFRTVRPRVPTAAVALSPVRPAAAAGFRRSRRPPTASRVSIATPRAARSSTSSSSFKRTAASTISSTAFPAPRPQRTATTPKRQQDQRLQPVGLETTWDIEHDYERVLRSLQRHGQLSRHGLPDERLRQRVLGLRPARARTPIRRTATCRTAKRSRTSYMGKHYVLADEMYASNFDASSFISHQYIIAGQASSAVNYPDGCVGLRRRLERRPSAR